MFAVSWRSLRATRGNSLALARKSTTPAPNRLRKVFLISATRKSKRNVTCRLSTVPPKGSITKVTLSTTPEAKANDNLPVNHVDRFDDLPDFPSLADNRRKGRQGACADNMV